jgi:hypothetical protein
MINHCIAHICGNKLLRVRDFDRIVLPFEFYDPNRKDMVAGQCYLRVIASNERIVFFFAQLPDYVGMSISNGIEGVHKSATEFLLQQETDEGKSIVEVMKPPKFIQSLPSTLSLWLSKKIFRHCLNAFESKCVWIEHYPPGLGLSPSGSFARIHFSRGGRPSWQFMDNEELASLLPGCDLAIDQTALSSWNQPDTD